MHRMHGLLRLGPLLGLWMLTLTGKPASVNGGLCQPMQVTTVTPGSSFNCTDFLDVGCVILAPNRTTYYCCKSPDCNCPDPTNRNQRGRCVSKKKGKKAGDGNAIGDPHFQGFGGGTFSFLGEPDSVFALFSDVDVHVNSRFVDALPDAADHDGTYLGIRLGSHPIELHTDGTWLVDGQQMDYGGRVDFEHGLWVEELRSTLQPVSATSCVSSSDRSLWHLSVADDERRCLNDKGVMLKFERESECTFALRSPQDFPCHTPAFVDSQQISPTTLLFPRWTHSWHVASTRFQFTFSTERWKVPHFDMVVWLESVHTAWPLPHGVLGQTTDGVPRQFVDEQGVGSIEGHWQDYRVTALLDTEFDFTRLNATLWEEYGDGQWREGKDLSLELPGRTLLTSEQRTARA